MGKWNEDTIQRKSQEFAALAAEFQSLKYTELEEKYRDLKDTKATLDDSVKKVNQRLAVIEAIFAEKFAEEGINSMKFESGYAIGLRFENPLRTVDKPAFLSWLKANGMESELTVYDARLKSISKAMLEEQGSLPPGIEQGDPVAVISYRKSK
jgi:hypothetical protein